MKRCISGLDAAEVEEAFLTTFFFGYWALTSGFETRDAGEDQRVWVQAVEGMRGHMWMKSALRHVTAFLAQAPRH